MDPAQGVLVEQLLRFCKDAWQQAGREQRVFLAPCEDGREQLRDGCLLYFIRSVLSQLQQQALRLCRHGCT